MANPSSSGYGNWDSDGQQWRSWVKIERTSLTATEAKFKVTAWMCAKNGSSSYASNIKGWAGIWDAATGDYRWSSPVNVGNFSAGDEWEFKSQTWTVKRTHGSQTVYGYSYIKAESGIYSGRTSNNSGNHAVTLTLDAKPSYAVSYNANGGSGAPSSQTKWHDETLTLRSETPTKSGYTFLGWATSSSATSAAYAAGASYTENAAHTLYAVWRKAITLTYNANGGSGAPSAVTKYVYNSTTSASFTISSTTPTKSGYSFLGWATSSTATSANGSYDPGDSPTLSSNVTLYAVWRKAITLTYNANGGAGAPAAVTQYAYNSATSSTFTISSTSPTRAGYTFLGWATSSTATTANGSYGAGKSVTLSASKAVYAVWKAAAPTLTGVRVWRSDSNGAEADEGTCAAVALSWTMATEAAVTVTATVNGHSETVTFASATSGTVDTGAASPSHPLVVDDANLNTEQSYTVTIEATANGNTTTVSATVPVAYYHIDLKANGHGVGIGMPAPSGVLGVGIDAEFHGNLSADGNVHVDDDLDVDGNAAIGGDLSIGGSLASRTNLAVESATYVQGNTRASLIAKKGVLNSSQWNPVIGIQTKSGGMWTVGNFDGDELRLVFFTKANIDSGTNSPTMNISIGSDGVATNLTATPASHSHSQYFDKSTSRTKNYVLAAPATENGAAAFRALAHVDMPHRDWTYLNSTTSSSTHWVRWRCVSSIVHVEVYYESGAGLSAKTAKNVGTISSGYRPSKTIEGAAYCGSSNNNMATIWVTTGGVINIQCIAAATAFYGFVSYPI